MTKVYLGIALMLIGLGSRAQIQFNQQDPSPFPPYEFGTVEVEDIDNNGLEDVILAGFDENGDSAFQIFLNQGSGNFIENSNTVLEVGTSALEIVDIDGDGDKDIFLSGQAGLSEATELFINELVPSGSLSFTQSTQIFQPVVSGSISTGDYDNNGTIDVFISGEDFDGAYIGLLYSNDPVGNFTPVTTIIEGLHESASVFLDINDDGWDDIIVGGAFSGFSGETQVYINDQNGDFIPGQTLPDLRDGGMDAGDVNGDGLPDLILAGGFNGGGYLFLNDPLTPGTFILAPLVLPAFASSDAKFDDFNSDGALDFVCTGVDLNTLFEQKTSIYMNDGAGSFTEITGSPYFGLLSSSIGTGNITGNANPEILITGNNSPFSGGIAASIFLENIGPVECSDDDGDGLCNQDDPCPNNAGATLDDCGICTGGDTGLDPCAGELILAPESVSATPCQEFTILVSVSTNTAINVVEAFLTFDPAMLEVTNVSEASGNPVEMDILPPTFDNAEGTISYIASTVNPTDSDFDFLEITFLSLVSAGNTSIEAILSGDPSSSIIVTQTIQGVQTPVDILTNSNPTLVEFEQDNTPPQTLCQNITVQLDASGAATITPANIDSGSFDECSEITLSLDQDSFSCIDLGDNTVTLTATDEAGNSTSCSATVTVEDLLTPAITCPTDETIYVDSSCEAVLGDYTAIVSSSDNCETSITQIPAAGSTLNLGITEVTLSATDPAGNSTNCTFSVQVVDNTSPGITCPENQTVYVDSQCEYLLDDFTPLATAGDNCSVEITQLPAAGTPIALGSSTITLTATDESGNSTQCIFDLTVEDNTAPTITCPMDQTIFVNETCSAVLDDYTSLATGNDNCSISISQSPAVGTSLALGTTQVTLSATDGNGNSSQCTFNVFVDDDIAPAITCPEDQTIFVNEVCEANLADYTILASASDNCSVSITQTPPPGSVLSLGSTAVTLTAADGAGNESSCFFNVNVEDNTAPEITCPDNLVIFADQNCEAILNDYTSLAIADDNCDVQVNQIPAPGSSLALGTTTITLNAQDNAGNISSCTFEVIVDDNISPEITCPDNKTITVNSECEAILNDYTGSALINDNCTVNVSQIPAPGTSIGLGTTTVELAATDASGNVSSCTFLVTAVDNMAPVISCPGADIVVVDASCASTLADYTSMANLDDNCSAIISQSPAPGTALGLGMTNITLTATDGAGNAASCSFIVRVEDNTDPNISCPVNEVLYVDENCSSTLSDYTAAAVVDDNCGAVVIQSPEAGTILNLGTTTVTLTATDNSGNSSSCSFDVSVEDNLAPAIACPSNQVVFFDSDCEATLLDYSSQAVFSDNCSATITQSPPPGTMLSAGITVVTLTAIDQAGNSSSCSFDVDVQDNTNPTLSCPGDQIVVLGSECTAVLADYTDAVTADDNCSVSISQSPVAGSTLNIGSNTVTIIATDPAGNTNSCSFNVIAEDQSNPTINCPSNQVVYVDAACEAQLDDYTSIASASDNCSFSISQLPEPGTTLATGITTVTLTANDNSGNSTSCSFEVSVEDETAPSIICPGDVIQYVNEFCTSTLDDYTTLATADDNCSFSVSQSPSVGTSISLGITSVTLTATDAFGNSNSCSFNVTVEDNLNPTISCPGTQTVFVDEDCSAVLGDYTSLASVDDNCSVSVLQTPAPGTSVELGTTTVTLTATDLAGNTSSCSFDVAVEDNSSPTIICLPDETVFADATCSYTLGDYTSQVTADDNCTVSISQSPAPGVTLGVGNTQVTITATDQSGNAATCTFNITVEDNTAPSISCAADGTRSVNQTNGTYLVSGNEFDATATDNCGGVSITHDASSIPGAISSGDNTSLSGWSLPVGVHTVTFSANDGNGNTSTCQVVITVQGIVISGDVTINLNCAPFNLRIRLYEPGTATLVAEQVTTIDASGNYNAEFTNVSAANYDVYLKVEGYLQQGYPGQDLSGGGAIINLSNLLNGDIVGGTDNFNDNFIGLNDLTFVIGIVFNNIFGGDAYDERADLNCDGVIDALDLSLVLFNFNSSGVSPQ